MKHPGTTIFLIALALRLAWVANLDERLTWDDEYEFAEVARGLARGHGYVSSSFRANPVLPTYLSLVFNLFGEHYLPARIGQSVIGALTCVLTYRIGSVLLGPTVGIASGFFLALYPPHIYVAGVFYVTCIESFFCALSVYLAALTIRAKGSNSLAFLCGICLGTTALTRSVFLVYIPCVTGTLMWATYARPHQRALAGLTVLVGAVLTILPWTVRNYLVFGKPILVSSGFYTKLWQGNNELALGTADDRDLMWNTAPSRGWLGRLSQPERRAFLDKYQEATRLLQEDKRNGGDEYLAMDRLAKPFVLQYMIENPKRTVLLFFKKLDVLYSGFSSTLTSNAHTSRGKRLLAAVSFYPMFALAVVGFWLARSRGREMLLLYSLIGSISFSYALLTACTRFRLPLDPFLIVFAATTVVWLWERWSAAKVQESQTARSGAPAQVGPGEMDRSAA